MRHLLPLSLAALALACSPAAKPDGGTDGGDELPLVNFTVSGTAHVHPDGLAWLADAGQSLSLVGLTLRVEEPFVVSTSDPPNGVFTTLTLDATGTFASTSISQDQLVLGVAAGIRDDGDGGLRRVVRSATVLYDDALEGKKPSGDITGARAYAIPAGFHDQLTQAVGSARIRALATAADAGTLVEAGCVLGRVVSASGAPQAGMVVQPGDATKAARLFYPSADLSTTVTGGTSSNGLFIYVHTGNSFPDTFSFTIAGHGEYHVRNAGAAKDSCVVLTVYPGLTQP